MRRIERRASYPDGKVCAFTGHRPSKYPYLCDTASDEYGRLREELSRHIDAAVNEGYTHFICGGALGADTLVAELILEKRENDLRLTLEIAVPCDGQDKYWKSRDKQIYRDILSRADTVTCLSDVYTPFCMQNRNQYMTERSQKLIAVYDGSRGGTYMTVLLALSRGIEVDIVRP